MKLKLTVDIDYKRNNVSVATLKGMLARAVSIMVGEGMITQDTDAEVKSWKLNIKEIKAKR